jgi:hypothetical protein
MLSPLYFLHAESTNFVEFPYQTIDLVYFLFYSDNKTIEFFTADGPPVTIEMVYDPYW